MAQDDWKWLEVAESCGKWLEMGKHKLKLLELLKTWKWKLLEIARMAGNG